MHVGPVCSYGQRFTVTRLESPRPFHRDGEHYGAGEADNFGEGGRVGEGGNFGERDHFHEGMLSIRGFGVRLSMA